MVEIKTKPFTSIKTLTPAKKNLDKSSLRGEETFDTTRVKNVVNFLSLANIKIDEEQRARSMSSIYETNKDNQ